MHWTLCLFSCFLYLFITLRFCFQIQILLSKHVQMKSISLIQSSLLRIYISNFMVLDQILWMENLSWIPLHYRNHSEISKFTEECSNSAYELIGKSNMELDGYIPKWVCWSAGMSFSFFFSFFFVHICNLLVLCAYYWKGMFLDEEYLKHFVKSPFNVIFHFRNDGMKI